MGRSIYCSSCKKEKELSCLNESRCKSCKSLAAKARRERKNIAEGKPESRPEREPKCDSCKDKKAQGISIAGRCNKCVTISNNERRHAKRVEEGLPVQVYDSSFCHVCNIPKIDGRCAPCRKRMAKERKAKKREESGKRPWGSGRPLTCYKCNEVKEKPDWTYCNKCQSAYDAKRWKEVIAPTINSRVRSDFCACGNERAKYKASMSAYCRECLAKKGRDQRAALHELGLVKKKKVGLTSEQKKIKQGARNITNAAIRAGYLMRQPCEICNTDVNIEAHHDDYSKPLDVRWLCKIHHQEHHNNLDKE